MKLRNMTIEDVSAVAEIEEKSFTTPWSSEAFEGSILQDNYKLIVAVSDDDDKDILGYCCFYYVADEAEIPNVCVREDMRGKGIGAEMLSGLMDIAKSMKISSIYLEVRMSNEPATRLYTKLGFVENGIRKGFYERPREDAIVMRYTVNA